MSSSKKNDDEIEIERILNMSIKIPVATLSINRNEIAEKFSGTKKSKIEVSNLQV